MKRRIVALLFAIILVFLFAFSAFAVDVDVTWTGKGNLFIESMPGGTGGIVIDVPQAGNASVTIPANSYAWIFQYPKDSLNIPVSISAGTEVSISGKYYVASNLDYYSVSYGISFYDSLGNRVIYSFDVPFDSTGIIPFSVTFKADRELSKLDTYSIRYDLDISKEPLSSPVSFYFYACTVSYLDESEQVVTAIDDQTEEIKEFFTPDIDFDGTLTDSSQVIRDNLGGLSFPFVLINEINDRIDKTDWTQASITFPSIDWMGQHFFGPITFDFNELAEDIPQINYLKTLLHLITGFICAYGCVRLAGRAISQIIGFVNPID